MAITPRDILIIKLRLKGWDLSKIGNKLGISKERVWQLYRKVNKPEIIDKYRDK